MTREAKIAVSVYCGAIVGFLVIAFVASGGVSSTPAWIDVVAKVFAVILVIGQLLCWRAGWRRYAAECAQFTGKRVDKFVVYVLLASFTLPFADITFPRWGF